MLKIFAVPSEFIPSLYVIVFAPMKVYCEFIILTSEEGMHLSPAVVNWDVLHTQRQLLSCVVSYIAPVGQAKNYVIYIPLQLYTGNGGPGNVFVGHKSHLFVFKYCPDESFSYIAYPEGQ